LWRDIAPKAARLFGCESSCLQLSPGTGAPQLVSRTANIDDGSLASYGAYFHRHELWTLQANKLTSSRVVYGEDLVEESVFGRSEIYNDWARPIGIRHLQGMYCVHGNAFAALGVHRSPQTGPFADRNTRRWDLLLSHFDRALLISSRVASIECERRASLATLSGLAVGILILSETGKIHYANVVAERLLQAGEGITVTQGRLRAQDSRLNPALDRRIAEAVLTSAGRGVASGGAILLERPHGAPLSLVISPLPTSETDLGIAEPAALVLINDPDAAIKTPATILARLYRLTPAEAHLLAALVDGETLARYAECQGVKLDTVKFHLKQIFQKTGFSRQADLVRAIVANPIIRLAGER
jgi:DNA-binding CsgD family transcriptional regulator